MLAGSLIGVPGPRATIRPPCTCRPSTAVGGRYRPTVVRSSPSSGATNTRSPTPIRRLGVSSGILGISSGIRESVSTIPSRAQGTRRPRDLDHPCRLTCGAVPLSCSGLVAHAGPALRPAVLRRAAPGGATFMLASVGAVQTGQVPQALSSVLQWILAWLSRIADWQAVVFQFVLEQDTAWVMTGKILALLLPAGVLIAGVWGTVLSVGTVPFRLGSTGTLLNSLLMAWWDAGRMCLFYWAGIVRFLVVLLAGIWGVFRLLVGLFWRTLKSAVTSPFALLDATSRQPGVPWIAFTLLLFWSAIEATIFTFTLRPTMAELLADLTGYEVNPFMLVVILWFFLFIVVAGSFASIQVLSDSVKSRQPVQIVLMVVAEVFVAMFEILFLYRELIDAITPWLAQQGFVLGLVGTLMLAFGGGFGVPG